MYLLAAAERDALGENGKPTPSMFGVFRTEGTHSMASKTSTLKRAASVSDNGIPVFVFRAPEEDGDNPAVHVDNEFR